MFPYEALKTSRLLLLLCFSEESLSFPHYHPKTYRLHYDYDVTGDLRNPGKESVNIDVRMYCRSSTCYVMTSLRIVHVLQACKATKTTKFALVLICTQYNLVYIHQFYYAPSSCKRLLIAEKFVWALAINTK